MQCRQAREASEVFLYMISCLWRDVQDADTHDQQECGKRPLHIIQNSFSDFSVYLADSINIDVNIIVAMYNVCKYYFCADCCPKHPATKHWDVQVLVLWYFGSCLSAVTVSPSGPRKLFKGVTTV